MNNWYRFHLIWYVGLVAASSMQCRHWDWGCSGRWQWVHQHHPKIFANTIMNYIQNVC